MNATEKKNRSKNLPTSVSISNPISLPINPFWNVAKAKYSASNPTAGSCDVPIDTAKVKYPWAINANVSYIWNNDVELDCSVIRRNNVIQL